MAEIISPMNTTDSIHSKREYFVQCWPLWPVNARDNGKSTKQPPAVSRIETRIDQLLQTQNGWKDYQTISNTRAGGKKLHRIYHGPV